MSATSEKLEEKVPDHPPSDDSEDIGAAEDGSNINERALIRKLDFKLLPAVTILYLMSFLDRSNGLDSRRPWFPKEYADMSQSLMLNSMD